MNTHTVKSYGDELNQLTAEVARMGGLAEAQVADAVESVARRDIALARAVVDRDVKLDGMHREIEKKAIRLIALRGPVASDLRKTLSAMKLATDLERTGDLARDGRGGVCVIAQVGRREYRGFKRFGRGKTPKCGLQGFHAVACSPDLIASLVQVSTSSDALHRRTGR